MNSRKCGRFICNVNDIIIILVNIKILQVLNFKRRCYTLKGGHLTSLSNNGLEFALQTLK